MQYTPAPIDTGTELPRFIRYVVQQLQQVANCLGGVEDVVLPMAHNPPERLTDGIIVLADGTDWNPGSGRGFYGYHTGAWHFLG